MVRQHFNFLYSVEYIYEVIFWKILASKMLLKMLKLRILNIRVFRQLTAMRALVLPRCVFIVFPNIDKYVLNYFDNLLRPPCCGNGDFSRPGRFNSQTWVDVFTDLRIRAKIWFKKFTNDKCKLMNIMIRVSWHIFCVAWTPRLTVGDVQATYTGLLMPSTEYIYVSLTFSKQYVLF